MATLTTVYQFSKPAVAGDADAWGGLLNTDLDSLDTFLARPRIKKNAPTVGASTTLDLSLATAFEFTVSQATTLSITNAPATLPDGTVPVTRVFLKITNGGAFAITWPGSIVWPYETANVAPTGLAASGVDLIELVSYDAGTTWYAMLHHIKTDPNLWPRVSVFKSANQSIPGATPTTLSWDSETFDVGAMHDNVTNNSRLTVPANQSGLYELVVGITFNSTSDLGQIIVRKNGTTIIAPGLTFGQWNAFVAKLVLAAADYIEIQVNTSSGTNVIANDGFGHYRSFAELTRVR